MKRSEVREHIFRILFCVEFCEKEEFEDQVELYFHGHESINEKTQKEITAKTENLIEHLDEIDEEISAHTNAWSCFLVAVFLCKFYCFIDRYLSWHLFI